MTHIDDWLDDPATGPPELKEWFETKRMSAVEKNGGFPDRPNHHESGLTFSEWSDLVVVTCVYKGDAELYDYLPARQAAVDLSGKRVRCIGASRLGDIWLTSNLNAINGYQLRPAIDDCSDFEVKYPTQEEIDTYVRVRDERRRADQSRADASIAIGSRKGGWVDREAGLWGTGDDPRTKKQKPNKQWWRQHG
jgi:hypothetical protein